ncbi:MAG: phosphoribosylanthranilate isomerase [Maribacter sp.]
MDYYYSKKDKNEVGKGGKPFKLKVCGMNKNTAEVAALFPDYLGFIFWGTSKRNFEGNMPVLPHSIKKVGVFVDADILEVKRLVEKFELLLVQLHGKESSDYCQRLKKKIPHIKIIKVFSIKDNFDFDVLKTYEDVCDFYLFDTKGKLPGGNGYVFNWSVLEKYPSKKPYFLSGGIGLEETAALKEFSKKSESIYCHAIDINSKFEIEPGLKKLEDLKEFYKLLSTK